MPSILPGRKARSYDRNGVPESHCHILPIVDAVLKSKETNPKPSIKAIIIYPMNALVNSQLEELDKYLGHYGENKPVTLWQIYRSESKEDRYSHQHDARTADDKAG